MLRVLSVITVVLIVAAIPAFAHAVLLEVTPPANGSVAGPDVVFQLRFNTRIDALRSVLNLVTPDGTLRPLPRGEQPSPNTLSVKADKMNSGKYTLRWQVLAADGHITRGEVKFQVK